MTPIKLQRKNKIVQAGFAMLITLVVVSVILAVGLSLAQITLKQIDLSITARDSQVAFYAANSGIECLQAERQTFDPAISILTELEFNCVNIVNSVNAALTSSNRTHRYQQNFSWNNGTQDLCTDVNMFIMDARSGSYTETFSNLGLQNKTCTSGNVCTIMFSTGYNRACNNLDGLRTVQRELTIEN